MKTLQQIYKSYSNDKPSKGGDKGTLHSYIDYYANLFEFDDMRNKAKRVVEIGIHTGHSLALWREYFPNALIIGVELNEKRIDKSLVEGCHVIIGDATKEHTFDGLDNIDVVIDDGSHRLQHQLKTFEILWPRMAEGGIYCIEDILDYNGSREVLQNLHSHYEIHDGRVRTSNPSDVVFTYFND